MFFKARYIDNSLIYHAFLRFNRLLYTYKYLLMHHAVVFLLTFSRDFSHDNANTWTVHECCIHIGNSTKLARSEHWPLFHFTSNSFRLFSYAFFFSSFCTTNIRYLTPQRLESREKNISRVVQQHSVNTDSKIYFGIYDYGIHYFT